MQNHEDAFKTHTRHIHLAMHTKFIFTLTIIAQQPSRTSRNVIVVDEKGKRHHCEDVSVNDLIDIYTEALLVRINTIGLIKDGNIYLPHHVSSITYVDKVFSRDSTTSA